MFSPVFSRTGPSYEELVLAGKNLDHEEAVRSDQGDGIYKGWEEWLPRVYKAIEIREIFPIMSL